MYNKRIKIFVILSALLLLLCLLRLAQMQLFSHSFYSEGIAELKLQKGVSRQLKTIRGKILDRKGRVLATNEPQFQLHINYRLSSLFDERVRRAKLLRAAKRSQLARANRSLFEARKELQARLEDLQQIIDKCVHFGVDPAYIENKIKKINDRIWDLRIFQAWRQKCSKSALFEKYKDDLFNVKPSDFIADFEKHCRNPNDRLMLIDQTNIAEMHKYWPLLELKTDDDIFTAQLEFMDIEGVKILSKAKRLYPYRSVAAQTIGWVGPAQPRDKKLFANDKLSRYLSDEVCGRRPGIEYVCETILRGRRGEERMDIDRQIVSRTETQFGKDVSMTLDIELQKKIEEYLTDCERNPNCKAPTAVVVIDVNTGDILALVSTPVFDLNRTRYDYDALAGDPNEPLRNRAINKGEYPPGSVIKPLILIAGLESGKITPHKIISCPAQKAPKGWPSCWLYNKYPWTGHDDKWQNYARNAIKGSCNIYFSRLADRIDTSVLQQWLFKFGYGHISSLVPRPSSLGPQNTGHEARGLRQVAGQISTGAAKGTISRFEQIPALDKGEKRYFGIGQGNLRATPLQVANAFAAIARRGVYKPPRLFLDSRPTRIENRESSIENRASSIENRESSNENRVSSIENRVSSIENRASSIEYRESRIDLNISPQTLDVIYDGMSAVVNEPGGTAYKEFAHSGFAEQDVKVYGKTGSTEKPDNAWFAGFAEDSTGRKLAIAVVVEGGQRGSADAAPLARDTIQFCIEAGYIGGTALTTE